MNIKSIIDGLNVPNVLMPFGEKISTKEEFEAIKPRIQKLLCEEEYGFIPKKPDSFKVETSTEKKDFCAGNATLRKHVLTANVYDKETSFVFYSVVPKNADGKIPVFIHISFTDSIPNPGQQTEEIVDQGYAVFTINYKDVTSDDGDFENGCAKVLCPDRNDPYAPGKIAMWSWAIMRVIDYLETLDKFDLDNIAVIGHSRLGKTALVAGMLDTRFKYVISNDSGCSGASVTRNKKGEHIDRITQVFPYWFCPNYQNYCDESKLTFDQHMLLATIAPRTLIVGSAWEDEWADPDAEYLGCVAASKAWENLGFTGFVHPDRLPTAGSVFDEGNVCYQIRSDGHYLSRRDWNVYFNIIKKKMR